MFFCNILCHYNFESIFVQDFGFPRVNSSSPMGFGEVRLNRASWKQPPPPPVLSSSSSSSSAVKIEDYFENVIKKEAAKQELCEVLSMFCNPEPAQLNNQMPKLKGKASEIKHMAHAIVHCWQYYMDESWENHEVLRKIISIIMIIMCFALCT